jgi:hypothetical protein
VKKINEYELLRESEDCDERTTLRGFKKLPGTDQKVK